MEEIGRRLRTAREAKGLSLEAAEDETKIRRKYIEALEAGDEAELPGDAYLKGFLRTYANYLGLDGPALVEEYKQWKAGGQETGARREPVTTAVGAAKAVGAAHPAGTAKAEEPPAGRERRALGTSANPTPVRSRTAGTGAQPAGAQARPAGGQARSSARRSPGGVIRPAENHLPRRVRRTLTIAVGLLLLAAIGYYGWQVLAGLKSTPAPQDTTPPAPPVDTTQQPPPTTPPPQLPEQPKVVMTQNGKDFLFAVPAGQVELTVNAGQRLWMQVTVDGKDAGQETFTGTRTFKGGEIKLDLGHMSKLTLTINGQTFDQFPKTGGPYTVTIGK